MSIRNSLAKIYVWLVFREDGELDSLKTQKDLKTQKELSLPEPPKSHC